MGHTSVTAGRDPLTGLPDRTGFAERAGHLLRTAVPEALVGLCYLDLGAPGVLPDPVTLAVAGRLSTLAAHGNVLARLGRDEFVLLIAGRELIPGAIAELGGRVLQVLTAPFPVGGHEVSVSARISVVERAAGETTHEDLMNAADRGMRQARARHLAHWMAVDLDRACALVRMR